MLFCYKYVRVLYIKLIQYDGDSFHLSKGRNVHGFIIKKKDEKQRKQKSLLFNKCEKL